jgi:hypothetical protein
LTSASRNASAGAQDFRQGALDPLLVHRFDGNVAAENGEGRYVGSRLKLHGDPAQQQDSGQGEMGSTVGVPDQTPVAEQSLGRNGVHIDTSLAGQREQVFDRLRVHVR